MDYETYVLEFQAYDHSYRMHPYHLGTQEKLAHKLAEEKFEAMNDVGDFVKFAHLSMGGKTVDTFNGFKWTSGFKD